MNLRPGKLGKLAAAPAVVLAMLALAGCQTHVGAAATVDGKTISEKSLNSYINPTIKNLTYSSGASVSPRTFVLQALLQEKVLGDLLAGNGVAIDAASLDKVKTTALNGVTESALTTQITNLGLPAKLEPRLLRVQEYAALLSAKFTTEAQQDAQILKYGKTVSVSDRYGQWDPATLGLTEFGQKQVSPVVRYTSPLPGDSSTKAS